MKTSEGNLLIDCNYPILCHNPVFSHAKQGSAKSIFGWETTQKQLGATASGDGYSVHATS